MERNNYYKVAITCTTSNNRLINKTILRLDNLNTLHKKYNEQK